MPRIDPLNTARADTETANTLSAVKAKLGTVPNLFTTLAHAPVALKAYLQLSETLTEGRLDARQREIVALAVAQSNRCQYCLSAHTLLGKGAGLSPADIDLARAGTASDELDGAIAAFARKVVDGRGAISDSDFQTLRARGIDDALAMEIIANIAVNVLTNYVNVVAGTQIDFPVVDLKAA